MAHNMSCVLQDVTKMYTTKREAAVARVNLVLTKNTVTALLGPNGSGKTTLMLVLYRVGQELLAGLKRIILCNPSIQNHVFRCKIVK